jgi:trehalose synthase
MVPPYGRIILPFLLAGEQHPPLRGLHGVNVTSTYYGDRVAELLGSMTILMSSVGIKTACRVIQGSPDFFSITKKIRNAGFT